MQDSTAEILKIAQREDGSFPFSKDVLLQLIEVRDANRQSFHNVEGSSFTQQTSWLKEKSTAQHSQGGGVMTLGRGKILEKCAVNMSVVWGDHYPALETKHTGKPYKAAGVSLICHGFNPYSPIAHMNVRILEVGEGKDKVTWVGGGADLTPMIAFEEDTQEFHAVMKDACSRSSLGDYEGYKKACDEYFFIPHRQQVRGVGGIFFDHIPLKNESDFEFLSLVGKGFAQVYEKILKRRIHTQYNDDLKEKQLHWRGRYAEFNLIYDRGTRFGLMTGGNTDAIFASLPPCVKW